MSNHFIAAAIGVGLLFSTPAFAEECCPQPNYQFTSSPCWGYGVNPAASTTPCDLSVSLDFLILKPHIDTFSSFYQSVGFNSTTGSQKGAALVGNTPDWDWGFEIGVGKGWNCIPFELNLSWMHFQTKQTSSPQFNNSSIFLIVPSGGIFSSAMSAPATFDLHLHFNQITFDISKEVIIGPKFFLTPALGVDYVDLRHQSSITCKNVQVENGNIGATIFYDYLQESFRNQVRAFGPSFSLSSAFGMDCGLRVDAGIKGALLWTQTRFNNVNNQAGNISSRVTLFEEIANETVFQFNHHILRPELIYNLSLTWMDEYSLMGPTFTVHAGWQGLFLFGVEETIFHIVDGKTFNLQGFIFGARVTF